MVLRGSSTGKEMALRKFFFDDGKSRKRWQILTKSQNQVINYGRLWGSLRESRKTYRSPAEAKAASAKLIAKKVRAGYVEIDPSRLEITKVKRRRSATEAQIKNLEKQIGCKLPREHRDFLKSTNGGQPNPDYVGVPGNKSIESIGVGLLYGLQPGKPTYNELTFEFKQAKKLLPAYHLPIGGDSDVYTISLHEKTFGSVFWWFHESSELDDDGNFLETAGYLLAGSFDEFLTRIAVMYGTEDYLPEPELPATDSKKAKSAKTTVSQLIRLLKHDHTPQKISEIRSAIKNVGDLSGIADGKWPFINLGDAKLLRELLRAGLNPEISDKEGHSLLWQCASSKECIDLLAKHDVNIDRRSGHDGETALMRAIFVKSIPAVKRLCQLGANPTYRMGSHIHTALEFNTKLQKVVEDARRKWIRDKPKAKGKSPKGKLKKVAPKHKKGSAEHAKAVRKFLRLMKHDYIQEPAEIDGIDEIVATIGDLGCIKNGDWPSIDKFEDPQLLLQLLETGLKPGITDKKGKTLLSQCVTHPDCIELLIRFGADPNQRYGKQKETALMRASFIAEEDSVQKLLDHGADPTIEFTGMAKIFLNMDEDRQRIIEKGKTKWKRKKKSKKKK